MLYLNSTLNFASIGIPVRSLLKGRQTLTGLTAQQKETTARWYSNKTSLLWNAASSSIIF